MDQRVQVLQLQYSLQYRCWCYSTDYVVCVQVSSASGLHNTNYMYSGVYSTVTDASK